MNMNRTILLSGLLLLAAAAQAQNMCEPIAKRCEAEARVRY